MSYKITLPCGTTVEGEQAHRVVEMALAMKDGTEEVTFEHNPDIDYKEKWDHIAERMMEDTTTDAIFMK